MKSIIREIFYLYIYISPFPHLIIDNFLSINELKKINKSLRNFKKDNKSVISFNNSTTKKFINIQNLLKLLIKL